MTVGGGIEIERKFHLRAAPSRDYFNVSLASRDPVAPPYRGGR